MRKINTNLPYFIDVYSMNALINEIEESDDDREISWNSLGGSVYAGQQFADFLNNKEGSLIANVSGIAASMGASLLPFFDKVKGAAQSDIMLHSASGGPGAKMKHTNEFLYEALKKKVDEEKFEKITGYKLKTVMLAEGDERVNVWFTGKDAKQMGLYDEVYDLLNPKNNIELPSNDIGYEIPKEIKEKYGYIKKENMSLDLSKLQSEHKELYDSIVNSVKKAELERVKAIFKYAKFDFEKAEKLINSGEELSVEHVEHFMEKKYNAQKIQTLEDGSEKDFTPSKETKNKTEKSEKEQALEEINSELGLVFDEKK